MAESTQIAAGVTDLAQILIDLDLRKNDLINQINQKKTEAKDILDDLRRLNCYYRDTKLSPKKWTMDELISAKKDLRKFNPTNKSHGDCGWKKDRWDDLQDEINGLNRLLVETEGQINTAREGLTKTADSQTKVYETQKLLEENQRLDTETTVKIIKTVLLVLSVIGLGYAGWILLTRFAK